MDTLKKKFIKIKAGNDLAGIFIWFERESEHFIGAFAWKLALQEPLFKCRFITCKFNENVQRN